MDWLLTDPDLVSPVVIQLSFFSSFIFLNEDMSNHRDFNACPNSVECRMTLRGL